MTTSNNDFIFGLIFPHFISHVSQVEDVNHGNTTSSGRSRSSRSDDQQPHVGRYRLIKTIGKGNFAKVKLAKHIPTGKEVRSLFVVLSITTRNKGQWPGLSPAKFECLQS